MSIFNSQSRAEDPNVSMRLIEKIKHKCQDYFREPSLSSDTYLSDLQSDIMQFKKDCLVAAELAYQFIIKTVEMSPVPLSKSDQLRLEYEIEKLTNENSSLKQEIESLKNSKELNENVVNLDNLVFKGDDDDERDKMISELQGQLVVQEMKFDNALADLEAENRELKEDRERVEKEIKECLRKNEILEKKVKESFSGFGKLMTRKSTANKELQTKKVDCCIELGQNIEIQRSTDLMSQISKLSITESEIFDMTSMQICEIHHQADTSITKTQPFLSLISYPSTLPHSISNTISMQLYKIHHQADTSITKTQPFLSLVSYPSTIPHSISNPSSQQICEIHHEADTSITKTHPLLSLISYPNTTPYPIAKPSQLEILQTSSLHIHPFHKHQTPSHALLSTSNFSLQIFPQVQIPSNLSIYKIFSFKNSLQISTEPQINHVQPKQVQSLIHFKCFSFIKIPDLHTEKIVACEKTQVEETKSRINRRKSTLNSASDRKPAIEEYFSLVFTI